MTENPNQNTNTESIASQTNDKKSDEIVVKSEEESTPIREDMVKTAVNFLLNPRVIESPLTQKRTFLMKKGLSLEEIDLAIDRSSNRLNTSQSHSMQPMFANNNNNPNMNPYMADSATGRPIHPTPYTPSFLVRSTQLMSSAVLLSGFLYGAYVLYKRFVEPLIFERHRKPHPFVQIQEQLDQLSKAMSLLQNNLSSIETNVKKQIEEELRSMRAPEDISLHELKTELSSIKALLVNRRQFAATPAVGSIPLWQLNDNKESINKSDNKVNNDCEQQMNGSVEDNDNDCEDINASNANNTNNLTNGSGVQPITADSAIDGLQD